MQGIVGRIRCAYLRARDRFDEQHAAHPGGPAGTCSLCARPVPEGTGFNSPRTGRTCSSECDAIAYLDS